MKNIYLTLLIVLTVVFTSSCQKDYDLLAEVLIDETIEETLEEIDLQDAIILPRDFDWGNIPTDFGNSIWEITEDFDLKGLNIQLPANVTLYFNGGSLGNGTITGDKAKIISKNQTQVFEGLNLAGSFETEYLKPYWFGAVMDGITDDRDIFVETLKQSNSINAKVLVEKDMFLDVEETGTKSIFLEDNTWVEGTNDVNIITNNELSPVFQITLTKNITVKNISFLHDNTYDATRNSAEENVNKAANFQAVEDYLTINHNVNFSSQNPVWRGGDTYRAYFLINAGENITFDNISFKSKGSTADTFIHLAIKLKEEYTANQTVSNSNGVTSVPKNIKLNNVIMDGVLMGVQGIVDGFISDGLRSYRYSDGQTLSGTNIGGFNGVAYYFAPPHLIYLNDDSSKNFNCRNIEIVNTIDYGEYVGSLKVRPTISGYCNSLKLTGDQANVRVENYKSYRRDGLGDLQNITNGSFKNIYSESNSSIFDPSFKFSSLRFVGTLNNVIFENIIIKDLANTAEIFPLDIANGDYVSMNEVHVYVNELKSSENGPFGISGSNNKIINSSLNIKKHTSTQTYRGVVSHTNFIMENSRNNYYDIKVKGWRSINVDPSGKSLRMLFASSANTNTNYARVADVDNNFVIEQNNNIKNDTWTRNEVVTLGSGTNQILNLNIPIGFTVNKISAKTIENLASGIKVSMGTSTLQKNNLLTDVSKTTGSVSKTINELTATTGNRQIYFFANGDFQNKGKIEVTLELSRVSQYN